jgi:hypothetical protein
MNNSQKPKIAVLNRSGRSQFGRHFADLSSLVIRAPVRELSFGGFSECPFPVGHGTAIGRMFSK